MSTEPFGAFDRRALLAGLALAPLALPLGRAATASPARRPHILWRQGWDIKNIGDVAHVPGAISLLRRYVPEASITLWASQDLVFRGETARLAGFADGAIDAGRLSRAIDPDLEIVTGLCDARGRGDNPALDAAIARADMMVEGTGAGLVGAQLEGYRRRTGGPIGFFGVTVDPMNFANLTPGSADVDALRDAAFIFTRDTLSLKVLTNQDPDGPDGTMRDLPSTAIDETINRVATGVDFSDKRPSFVPDTAFAFRSRDEASARAFMARHGLEPGRFACFVPRHRWTPTGRPTPKGDSREAYDAAFQPQDLAKMRIALTDYVTRTGNRAALVPETIHGLALLKEMRDQLPPAILDRTAVMDGFWLPDMAASLFGHAQVVVSMENHSPIIAATAGTPFVMLHQPEDTIKSQMFSDIGLDDWYVHDIGAVTGADISRIMMRIVRDQGPARARLARVMQRVADRQRAGMETVRRALSAGMRR